MAMRPTTLVIRGTMRPVCADRSRLNNCMPPMRRNGSTKMAKVTTPNPPNQTRRKRHSSSPFGASSSPTITVDPVAVSPDMVSK